MDSEGAKACHRYVTNRIHQLDYLGVIEQELPIGSDEIESSHRRVAQRRLKRSGAWWKIENAQLMLQLLTLQANDLWSEHWEYQKGGNKEAA